MIKRSKSELELQVRYDATSSSQSYALDVDTNFQAMFAVQIMGLSLPPEGSGHNTHYTLIIIIRAPLS